MIVGEPAATPPTTPEVPTVASATLLLLHAPPGVASFKVMFEPTQTVDGEGVIPAGDALTVIGKVAIQPVPTKV